MPEMTLSMKVINIDDLTNGLKDFRLLPICEHVTKKLGVKWQPLWSDRKKTEKFWSFDLEIKG